MIFSKTISIDSLAISPTANNSKDFTISLLCNKLEFNPLLSKLVIVEQSTDATNVGVTLVFQQFFQIILCTVNQKSVP